MCIFVYSRTQKLSLFTTYDCTAAGMFCLFWLEQLKKTRERYSNYRFKKKKSDDNMKKVIFVTVSGDDVSWQGKH